MSAGLDSYPQLVNNSASPLDKSKQFEHGCSCSSLQANPEFLVPLMTIDKPDIQEAYPKSRRSNFQNMNNVFNECKMLILKNNIYRK